jgi:hypothetical protein
MVSQLEIAANLIGLVGALALFVPAIYAAQIVRAASRLSRNAGLVDDAEIEGRRKTAIEEFLNRQNQWNWKLGLCLFGGMALSALSYVLLLWHELGPASSSSAQ